MTVPHPICIRLADLRTWLFIGLLILMPAACDRSSAKRDSDDKTEPVRTVASVYALGDLVRQVGGKYVQVESIIEGGQSLAGFAASPELRDRMNRAELIIAGGSMTEPWAVSDSANQYAPERVIRLDALPASAPGAATRPGISETGLLWLDPVVAQQAARELAERLTGLRPRHDVYFRHQADSLNGRIDELLKHYAPLFEKLPPARRRVVALSGEFDPLARRFAIEVVHVVDDPAERLSEDQMRLLRDTARELSSGAGTAQGEGQANEAGGAAGGSAGGGAGGAAAPATICLLVRADTPTALLQDLALRTGMRMVPLDSYGGASNPERDTLLKLLAYDIDELARGVGALK